MSTNRWIFAVLGAAVVSLACGIAGMFIARANLVDASEWVRHTSEVQLSIAACNIHVHEAHASPPERSNSLAEATADAEHVRTLTADNPTQQLRVKALIPLLLAFTGNAAGIGPIDLLLDQLAAVEGSLKDIRMTALRRATRTGWVASSVSAGLTVVLVALMLGMLHRQSRALARAHASLAREGALLESVVDSMVDGVMAITPARTFLHVNRAARRLLGDDFPEETFPKDWRANIECHYEDGSEMKPEDGALARAIAGKSTDNLVYKTRQTKKPNDPGTWISATARPVRDTGGVVIAGVVALRDITEQKQQQDQLRAISMADELTGLHNRRGFLLLAEQHARMARRHGHPFGIVFADLNGLKTVNDSLGHEAGDQAIRAAAGVLRETFRESDIVARLGGDEFVVLLAAAEPTMHAAITARMDRGLAEHNGRVAPAQHLSLSMGVAFFDPDQPVPLSELMVEADRLMYADKRAQRRTPAR